MHPLSGKRIVITRAKNQAERLGELLYQVNAEPIFFPVIKIDSLKDFTRLDEALKTLSMYDWLILTSANGVNAVWDRLEALEVPILPKQLKIAAIGPKTKKALEKRDVFVTFMPEEYVAEAILPGLGELQNKRILLLRADIARKTLPELIMQSGGHVTDVIAYRTIPTEPEISIQNSLGDGVDVISFTSPSTVSNFANILKIQNLAINNLPGNPVFVCIGPITRKEAKKANIDNVLSAKNYTIEGLVDCISEYYEGMN